MNLSRLRVILNISVPVFVAVLVFCPSAMAAGTTPEATVSSLPVWAWAIILFAFCCGIGVVSILAGIGGGVLFVPLADVLFPFHIDFIRGAALFSALAGALSASSRFLRHGLTFPRLVFPLSVSSSIGAFCGAAVGLALPETIIRIFLGVTVLGICLIMVVIKRSELPYASDSDPLASALKIQGEYYDASTHQNISWKPQRLPLSILLFTGIGFLAGVFGLGAGWANVPVLNLVMGLPLKVAVASSLFVLSIANTPAALVYLNSGAVLPAIVIPCVSGMMLGSIIGSRLVTIVHPKVIHKLVVALLAVAGVLSLLKGLRVL